MATASTSQHCTDKGGGVGEYSFGHLRFYFFLFFLDLEKDASQFLDA